MLYNPEHATAQDEASIETMPDAFMAQNEYIAKMRKLSTQLRVHPTRTFYPGQTYSPEVHSLKGIPAWSLCILHYCADANCPPVCFRRACTAPSAAGALRGPPLGDGIQDACLQ